MSAPSSRRPAAGMAGGGAGAGTGRPHRCAVRPDDLFELQAATGHCHGSRHDDDAAPTVPAPAVRKAGVRA